MGFLNDAKSKIQVGRTRNQGGIFDLIGRGVVSFILFTIEASLSEAGKVLEGFS